MVGFKGRIIQDRTNPDGTMRKLMEVSRLERMGWTASIPLEQGVEETYQWFLENRSELRSPEAPICKHDMHREGFFGARDD